jgi:hypothetical protein
MSTKQHNPPSQASDEKKPRRKKTPTFEVELPVEVNEQQAASLQTTFEVARQLYNAILSLGLRRLRHMRADPSWQQARAIPRTHKAERKAAFTALRETYGFTEYALQEAAKSLRVGHLAEHIEAVVCQVLATRAYRSLQRVALGRAKNVRFKRKGRGLGSVENKRNDTGLRFAFGEQMQQAPDDPLGGGLVESAQFQRQGMQKRARREQQTPAAGTPTWRPALRWLRLLERAPVARPHRLERPCDRPCPRLPCEVYSAHPTQSEQPAGQRRCWLPLLLRRPGGARRRAVAQTQAWSWHGHRWC